MLLQEVLAASGRYGRALEAWCHYNGLSLSIERGYKGGLELKMVLPNGYPFFVSWVSSYYPGWIESLCERFDIVLPEVAA